MDYNIFKECILEAIAERFGDDCKIEYKEVLKNNGIRLDGLLVRFSNKSISPTVYVNDYYDRYVAGEEIDEIADHIVWLIKNNSLEDDFDPESLILFENIKERIVYKLVNYEKNEDLLKTVPHKKFLDLAVVYYISIKEDIFESASILINNAHLELWGKTMEDIDRLAKENSPRILKPELKSMAQTLMEIIRHEKKKPEDIDEDVLSDCGMYVLSNEKKQFGASAILYDNVIKDFSESLNSDLYILPSSVHEVIMIPSILVDSVDKLNEMICEVNATQVPLIDILSNHSYYYSRDKECITCA
ncbi:MAG: hypothetical protein II399_10070 [Lachnospiraceae bacterium]|nr:hypothetical protein [Lachnospiraceae bacterium]